MKRRYFLQGAACAAAAPLAACGADNQNSRADERSRELAAKIDKVWAAPMLKNDCVQIVQPDLLYFGGLIRSVKVARMAAAAGMDCTAHMSGGGLGYLYVAHFASCVPNCGPHQEYKGDGDTAPVTCDTSSLKSQNGMIKVPSGPGLGVKFDPAFVNKAIVVSA